MSRDSPPIATHVPGEPGIWIMIFGDMLVFGIMFLTFVTARRDSLPMFEASQGTLDQGLGLLNTVFMLSSSWFVALGMQSARERRRRATAVLFGAALICGVGFTVVKGLEYTEKVQAGIVINTNDFYMYYFVFTGIHLLHVLIGIGVLIFMIRYSRAGSLDARQVGHLESGASFWHLVDLLWIALFALLYLLK